MGSSAFGLPALALLAPPPMPEVEGPKRTFSGKCADLGDAGPTQIDKPKINAMCLRKVSIYIYK